MQSIYLSGNQTLTISKQHSLGDFVVFLLKTVLKLYERVSLLNLLIGIGGTPIIKDRLYVEAPRFFSRLVIYTTAGFVKAKGYRKGWKNRPLVWKRTFHNIFLRYIFNGEVRRQLEELQNCRFGNLFRFFGGTFTNSPKALSPPKPSFSTTGSRTTKYRRLNGIRKKESVDLLSLHEKGPWTKLGGLFSDTYWSSSDICRPFSLQYKHICTRFLPCKKLDKILHLYKAMTNKHQAPEISMKKVFNDWRG